MKKLVLPALSAFLLIAGLNTAAIAGNAATLTSECGVDVMFTYNVPRDETGAIVFARSYEFGSGEVIDEDLQMETTGNPVCLAEGSGNVHLLRTGTDLDIKLSSQHEVTQMVRWLESETLAEALRVEKAYGIGEFASN